MKIVIAMDSFKAALAAGQACEIVADVIAQRIPHAHLSIKPMADGGKDFALTRG